MVARSYFRLRWQVLYSNGYLWGHDQDVHSHLMREMFQCAPAEMARFCDHDQPNVQSQEEISNT